MLTFLAVGLRYAVELRAPAESCVVGVGSNSITTLGSMRSPLDPRWFGPPFVPSSGVLPES
jgi:hypothetical protein